MLSFLGTTATLPLPLALPFPIVGKQACQKRFLQKHVTTICWRLPAVPVLLRSTCTLGNDIGDFMVQLPACL